MIALSERMLPMSFDKENFDLNNRNKTKKYHIEEKSITTLVLYTMGNI